jgi:hypothetical protein
MKKITLTLAFLFALVYFAAAQQASKTRHMIISIVENLNSITIGHSPNMFVTRDDTAQTRQYVDFRTHGKLKDAVADHEAQIMAILKPFYDQGWKLVTTSVTGVPEVGNAAEESTRYFFVKEE